MSDVSHRVSRTVCCKEVSIVFSSNPNQSEDSTLNRGEDLEHVFKQLIQFRYHRSSQVKDLEK